MDCRAAVGKIDIGSRPQGNGASAPTRLNIDTVEFERRGPVDGPNASRLTPPRCCPRVLPSAVAAVCPVLKKTPVCQSELIAAANSFWRTLLAYNRLYARAILPSPQDVGVNIVVREPPPELAPDRDAVVKHRHLLLHLDKRLTEHAKVKHPHEFMALYKLALAHWIEDLGGGPNGAKRGCRDDPLIDGMRRDAKRLLKRLALFAAVPHFKDLYAPSLWWLSLPSKGTERTFKSRTCGC
jgi:hypothetical protein